MFNEGSGDTDGSTVGSSVGDGSALGSMDGEGSALSLVGDASGVGLASSSAKATPAGASDWKSIKKDVKNGRRLFKTRVKIRVLNFIKFWLTPLKVWSSSLGGIESTQLTPELLTRYENRTSYGAGR